jgi:hypothetical protein
MIINAAILGLRYTYEQRTQMYRFGDAQQMYCFEVICLIPRSRRSAALENSCRVQDFNVLQEMWIMDPSGLECMRAASKFASLIF